MRFGPRCTRESLLCVAVCVAALGLLAATGVSAEEPAANNGASALAANAATPPPRIAAALAAPDTASAAASARTASDNPAPLPDSAALVPVPTPSTAAPASASIPPSGTPGAAPGALVSALAATMPPNQTPAAAVGTEMPNAPTVSPSMAPAAAPTAPASAGASVSADSAGVLAPGGAVPAADTAAPPAASTAATDAPAGAVATAADPAATLADQDLWGRIRRGFKMPDLDSKKAQNSTRWYAAQPDYIARMTTRASMYLYYIVDEIEKRGMPTELALLPFVESAMQPEAVSFAKAAGLWQFIPSTGRLYSLEQSLWKDERFGVMESTRAALDYLQKLYAEFGDWQLALAAYNCGEAGVERALARARKQHRSLAYKDLRLPNETQYYVPKLQAIKNIVADPQRFGIELPAIRNAPFFVAVSKAQDMDVTTAARLADMPLEDFRALNPAFNRPVIVGASSPTILLPADRAESFNANLAAWQATGQPLAIWTAYTLQPNETLAKVAERVGLTEAQLREANRIPPRYRAAAGSTILVPRDENSNDDIAPGFITASFALVPESGNLRQITVRVRRGDTLASVAHRWHVSPEDIMAWNQLSSTGLFAGQRLNLTVARAAGPAPHKAAKKSAAPSTAVHVTGASTVAANGTAAAHVAATSSSRM